MDCRQRQLQLLSYQHFIVVSIIAVSLLLLQSSARNTSKMGKTPCAANSFRWRRKRASKRASNRLSRNNMSIITSPTGRAILFIATTIVSTSASIAMGNMPINLLPSTNLLPPTSTTDSTTTTSYENNNWPLDNSSWPTMNQSFTDEDALIEMDLVNETLSDSHPPLRRYYGAYDVSYMTKINTFWLQFEPPSMQTYYILAVIYIIISSFGCAGNSFVIFMFIRCKSLRTPANILIVNLAVSDLLMLIKCPIAIYNNFKQGPALGDTGCRIYGFIGGLSGTASIGTLTAIALDRYNVVVYPLKTVKYRYSYTITIIWTYSFAFSIVPALDIGLSVYVPEGYLTTCGFDYLDTRLAPRIFMFSFFIAAWGVPLGIICFSYYYILKVVFAANRIRSNKDRSGTEQKLAMTVAVIIGLWFLAWTPYSIVAMMGVFGQQEHLTPLISMVPALFCKTAACIDPYLYAVTHPRFRMECRRLWHGRNRSRRTSHSRSTYVTRSSTRRLRVINGVDIRNNLPAVQEMAEENDEAYEFSVQGNSRYGIEQSRF